MGAFSGLGLPAPSPGPRRGRTSSCSSGAQSHSAVRRQGSGRPDRRDSFWHETLEHAGRNASGRGLDIHALNRGCSPPSTAGLRRLSPAHGRPLASAGCAPGWRCRPHSSLKPARQDHFDLVDSGERADPEARTLQGGPTRRLGLPDVGRRRACRRLDHASRAQRGESASSHPSRTLTEIRARTYVRKIVI
jgi:hypothetical protein